MDISKYDIEIKHHVFVRAIQRKIHPDIIEETITKGKIEKYGKNYVKFKSKYFICVGEVCGTKLKIITIERRKTKK